MRLYHSGNRGGDAAAIPMHRPRPAPGVHGKHGRALPSVCARLVSDDGRKEGKEEMSVCKGCGREIDWIRTAAGKSMPIDPEPVFVIEGDGKDLFFTDEGGTLKGRAARSDEVTTREAKLETPLGFVPHWKTCPNAAEFRRRR